MHDLPVRHGLLPVLAAGLLLGLPASAVADDGSPRDDVRVAAACSGTSRATLRVRHHDGALRVDVDVSTKRRGATWAVVVVHERRIAFRGRVRTGSGSGSFSLRRTLEDWPGRDGVTVRATGPGGEVCRAAAAIEEG